MSAEQSAERDAQHLMNHSRCLSKLPLEEIPDMPEMAVAFEVEISGFLLR